MLLLAKLSLGVGDQGGQLNDLSFATGAITGASVRIAGASNTSVLVTLASNRLIDRSEGVSIVSLSLAVAAPILSFSLPLPVSTGPGWTGVVTMILGTSASLPSSPSVGLGSLR